MQTLGALFLLAVAYGGYREGELPVGTSLLRAYRLNREDNALAFWFFMALYACGGMALAVWDLLALVEMAPTLKLR